MAIGYIMSILKNLTGLCVISQKAYIKNTFAEIVYNVLVVKVFWYSIKKCF